MGIDILYADREPDECGNNILTLVPVAMSVWAYFRQLSQKEIYTALEMQTPEEVLFQISYRPDISTTHIIRYKGVYYDITRVDVFEGYKGNLTLYCKKNETLFTNMKYHV